MKKLITIMLAALLVVSTSAAWAGPVIIDGTDANDHGSVLGGVNVGGWEYMQKALENLGPQVGNGQTQVVTLGTTSSGGARNAINSAFNLSTLPGAGWTITHIDGEANITNYFNGVGATTLANTGILYIPTVNNAGGDMSSTELAVVNANAAAINTYVGGAGNPLVGGGLFSQGESAGAISYGWLTTLIPGIVVTDIGGGGVGTDMTLTPAGSTAFPGLTNADLVSADPWHNYFTGSLGGLSVLATAPQGLFTRNIILGGGAGTVIGCGQPGQLPCPPPLTSVPEPSTLLLLGSGIVALSWARRRR